MKHTSGKKQHLITIVSVVALIAAMPKAAGAYTFDTSSDWEINLDTHVAYSLSARADKMNGKIGNNILQQNDEYKFPDAGDITTNRFDITSELDASYQGLYGGDVSVSGWKDFAYNGGAGINPQTYAPGVPYSAVSSAPGGSYSSYTEHFYNLGAELQNAFVFYNGQVGNMPISFKVGRFTEYWGNTLFSGGQAISYGQSPLNIIKALAAPGSEVKDLFMPRGQASVHLQATNDLTLGFQYQFEFRPNRFSEGGTFLGILDPIFNANTLAGSVQRGDDHTPPAVNGDFGIEAVYSPDWLNGSAGVYFRQFDDPTAYGGFNYKVVNGTPVDIHNAYAEHVHLYGLSLDRNVGTISVGTDASIRTNTGLYTIAGSPAQMANDPLGYDGARGSTLNLVANAIVPLTPNPLWQTGSLVAEIAYTHLLAITHGKEYYDGDKMNGCGSQVDGCATDNEANINVLFDPQWLQVFPGIDIDAPMNLSAGIWGNGQTLYLTGTGSEAGTFSYSAGVHALIRNKWNIKLAYSGYEAPTSGVAKTASGLEYYTGGDGNWAWDDKAQVQLTLYTDF